MSASDNKINLHILIIDQLLSCYSLSQYLKVAVVSDRETRPPPKLRSPGTGPTIAPSKDLCLYMGLSFRFSAYRPGDL